MRSIAIVGSGPSGVYCAEALLRADPAFRIDIVERLPTPFGLVRFGVSPDHQTTKGVARLLDRVLAKPEVAFFGGVTLGRDVTLDELRAHYDAVVIATGASLDRELGVPGETLPGVYASGCFVGWYNQHPDHAAIALRDVRAVVAIGSGNVALDVARILAKSDDEFAGSDLAPDVLAALASSGIERIHVVGRSGPSAMKFSDTELLEFGELARAVPRLGAGGDGDLGEGKAPAALRAIVDAGSRKEKPIEIVFEFGLRPVAFEGDGLLERVRFCDAAGNEVVRDARLAVTCIGYASHGHDLPCDGGMLRNDAGRVDDGLYVVGWAKRGPSGTIPTNRTEATLVAKRIASEIGDGAKPGRDGLRALVATRIRERIDYAAWRRIDAAEVARAGHARTRHKFHSLDDLLAAAAAN